MTIAIRNWVQSHRYQVTIRRLQALSAEELRALGIAPTRCGTWPWSIAGCLSPLTKRGASGPRWCEPRPIAETITRLLDAVRVHAGIALWPTGEQALANCQRLIDMARHFGARASSFRAFVEKLEADAERGEADEAPIVEEGTEGVRLLTVHKAKGLEFPVVILADPTCNAARDIPSRHVDTTRRLWFEPLCGCAPIELREAAAEELRRDQAEAIRIAYVAATRARDLLVAPVCGDEPIEGWLEVLDPMLYPSDDARRQSEPAPGCPAFGEDSVVDRGPQGDPPSRGLSQAGPASAEGRRAAVVWWDPAALSLEVQEQMPLRHQRILEVDPDGTAAAASEKRYADWKTARGVLLAQGSRPSMSVHTVTALARAAAAASATGDANAEGGQAQAPPDIIVEMIERGNGERPGGRRFGALVHALLASLDLDAGGDAIQAAAAINGRLVDATDEEVQAAVTTVGAALAHPILRRAAASAGKGGLRRETPVLLRRDDTAAWSRARSTSPSVRIRLNLSGGPWWISRPTASSRRWRPNTLLRLGSI